MPAPLSTETVRARLGALMPDLGAEYGVRSLSLFGSYARGEQTPESDLDLLVDFDTVPGLFPFVGAFEVMGEAAKRVPPTCGSGRRRSRGGRWGPCGTG